MPLVLSNCCHYDPERLHRNRCAHYSDSGGVTKVAQSARGRAGTWACGLDGGGGALCRNQGTPIIMNTQLNYADTARRERISEPPQRPADRRRCKRRAGSQTSGVTLSGKRIAAGQQLWKARRRVQGCPAAATDGAKTGRRLGKSRQVEPVSNLSGPRQSRRAPFRVARFYLGAVLICVSMEQPNDHTNA